MITTIPEVLHICDGCGGLASGQCAHCGEVRLLNERLEARWHARRAADLYNSLPRVTPPPPAPAQRVSRWVDVKGWGVVLLGVAVVWLLFPLLIPLAVWFGRDDVVHEPLI